MKKALLISSLSALVVIGGGFAAFAVETPIPANWVSSTLEAIANRDALHISESGFYCDDFYTEMHHETYNLNVYGEEVEFLNQDARVKKTTTEDGFVLDAEICYNHSSGVPLPERYVSKGGKYYHVDVTNSTEIEINSEAFNLAFLILSVAGYCCDDYGAFQYKEQLLHPDSISQSWGNLYVHKTADNYQFSATIDLFTKRLKELEYITKQSVQYPPATNYRTITKYVFH